LSTSALAADIAACVFSAPPCIKKSITVGLGLFQALIGFECIKLVVPGMDVLLTIGAVLSSTFAMLMREL
jgi:xanthine/uracil/vitamin C permease (AzgA family)